MTRADDVETEAASKLARMIREGADIVGAAGGAVAGFMMGGPVGAGVGAAACTFLQHRLRSVGEEVIQRHLSFREQRRVGALLAATAEAMREKIDQGQQPRNDDFFEPQNGDRSAADEITEGVLMAAQREHEERKIYFMGRMLANIAFAERVDKVQANFLLRTAEGISYRALCILFVARHSEQLELYDKAFTRYEREIPAEFPSLLSEVYQLYVQSLLMFPGIEVMRLAYMVPAKMKLQGVGADLYELMELEKLRERPQDWMPIAQLLGSTV